MPVKYFLLIILILLSSLCVISQTDERKGFLGIAAGGSFPIGVFGDKKYLQKDAGYAKAGALLDIQLAYRLGKKAGVAILLRGQSNSLDVAQLSKDQYAYTGQQWKMEADNWRLGGFLAGFYYTTPFNHSEKIFFDGRLLVGFVNATSPVLNKFDIATNIREETIYSANTTVYGILAGGGIRYNIERIVSLLLNADIFFAEPEFRNVKYDVRNYEFFYNIHQPMVTINISFGIAFRLK